MFQEEVEKKILRSRQIHQSLQLDQDLLRQFSLAWMQFELRRSRYPNYEPHLLVLGRVLYWHLRLIYDRILFGSSIKNYTKNKN